jgi:hypothetical protein
MRRGSRRIICEPAAISGEVIASRAQQRRGYGAREPEFTSAIPARKDARRKRNGVNEEDEFQDE